MQTQATSQVPITESVFTLAAFGLFVGVGAGLAHLGFLALTSWPVLLGCAAVATILLLWRINEPWRFESPKPVTKPAVSPLVVMPPSKSTYR